MSIYATLWELQFPLHGQSHTDCEWVSVLAQGVPAHVGEEGDAPYLTFLPPRSESIQDGLRAVVFVRAQDRKGTDRSPQEYQHPLLMLSGKEYASMPFPQLHELLAEALRGTRPQLVAEVRNPDGSIRVMYEDGTALVVRGDGA
jgi:hypothetical protein